MAVARETLLVGRGSKHTLNVGGEPRSEAFWATNRFVFQAQLWGHLSMTLAEPFRDLRFHGRVLVTREPPLVLIMRRRPLGDVDSHRGHGVRAR